MNATGAAAGHRGWTALLVALALAFPLGALLQPVLWPSRSALPVVERQLHAPILLITVAGLRADRLTHLGYARPTTPALDLVAHEGVSFPLFQASANEALVTLAALFTGRCPADTGVRGPADRLAPAALTLAERLRENGYAAGGACADPALAGHGLEQGLEPFRLLPGAPADELLDAALQILRDAPRENVFVWADLGDLLPPYGGPALDNRRFAPDAPAGFGSSPEDYVLDAAAQAERGWGARELSWLAARYDAALAGLDAAIGRCLQTLQAEGRLESMTVCITGTRGERLDERAPDALGRAFAHADLSEPSLHVPLLLRLPGKACRGLLPRRLAQSTDVAPTLADIGAHRDWETPVGRSLRPVLLWQQRVHKSVFAEGLVQPADGSPAWRGFVQRMEALSVLTDEGGAVRAALRILDEPWEQQPMSLGPEHLQIIAAQRDGWPVECGGWR